MLPCLDDDLEELESEPKEEDELAEDELESYDTLPRPRQNSGVCWGVGGLLECTLSTSDTSVSASAWIEPYLSVLLGFGVTLEVSDGLCVGVLV